MSEFPHTCELPSKSMEFWMHQSVTTRPEGTAVVIEDDMAGPGGSLGDVVCPQAGRIGSSYHDRRRWPRHERGRLSI